MRRLVKPNESTTQSCRGRLEVEHQHKFSSSHFNDDASDASEEEDENDFDIDDDTMITLPTLLLGSVSVSTREEESIPLLDNTSDHNTSDKNGDSSERSTKSDRRRRRASAPPSMSPRDSLPSSEECLPLDAPIIEVIDRIEDEMEAHAYEDLVPLEIKLALEDRVFGWTHMTSAIFGHTLFTIGSYCLVNELFKFAWAVVRHTEFMPPYVVALRIGLSLWAAVNAYRFVRRRRQVWFRAAYGTRAYKQDAARRRQSVRETDRTTKIGQIMKRFQHRRKLKKLRKAEKMFAKSHHAIQKRRQKEQELQQLITRPLVVRTRGLSSDMDNNSSSESEESSSSDSGNLSYESALTAETAAASCSSSPSARRRALRRPSFRTKPVSRMQSYAHDEILFPSITNMPYAHGGFFGAAPFLLGNPHWISILRHLMPDVYVEISRRVAHSKPSKLIHWAENNPVVAAYGAAHELEFNSHIPNLEWDVFLDPVLVHRVQVVLDAREKYLASHSATSPQAKPILQYYKSELRKRSKALVDKMLIAHGSTSQLVTELTGYAKHFNYSRVKRTRQTLGGGIYARQWMAVFAEALKLGVVGSMGDDYEAASPAATSSSSSSSTLDVADDSNCPQTTMSESVRIVESIAKGKEPLGLVLDLKSLHVSKRIWSVVVDTLRASGIRVEGIGSFSMEEIRGVSRWCEQPVQECIFFHSAGDLQQACHEGRIQHGDKIFMNGGSLINETRSPDLLGRILNFDPQEIKDSYRIQPFGMPRPANQREWAYPTIQLYKEKYSLSIGLYCQEFDIDEAAIRLMAQHVNTNPTLFDMGLAWGGVNGITIKGIAPGRFTSTDGHWNQRIVGANWDYNLIPTPTATSSSDSRQAISTKQDRED